MSERVTMPALGESVTEGTVTRWLKQVGDAVSENEPLIEIETEAIVGAAAEELLVRSPKAFGSICGQ